MRVKGKAEIPFNWEEIQKSFIKEVAKKGHVGGARTHTRVSVTEAHSVTV